MVFASLSFIFFVLPLFLAFDFSARVSPSVSLRNAALLGVSLLFYIWGEATNVFILLALGVINYGALVAVFIVVNLSVLIGFKYAWWLLSFVMPELAAKKAPMPLGISFFTFHALSYLIDVYRRQIAPAKNALDFLTYPVPRHSPAPDMRR